VTAKEADEIKTARDLAYWEHKDAEEQAVLARLQVEVAEAELKLREVRSTVDGIVMERNRDPGESSAGVHILKIAQLNPLYVETFVPVSKLDRLAVGALAEVKAEGLAGPGVRGKVTVIDRVADAASGMTKLRITVPNGSYEILSGVRCTVVVGE
jgi:membrane fusion protein (multidrug efflux system)